MKNSTKRIFVSILTLVLTVVAVGTTTLAWFTIGNVATVRGFEADVQSGEGLEIKLVSFEDDGTTVIHNTNFKNHITQADWNLLVPGTKSVNNEEPEFTFKAINSDKEKLAMITEDALNPNNIGHLKFVNAVRNKDYVEVEVTFRSLTAGVVELSMLELVGEQIQFKAGVAYQGVSGNLAVGDTETFNSDKALRVTFEGGNDTPVTLRVDHSVSVDHGNVAYLDAKSINILYGNELKLASDLKPATLFGDAYNDAAAQAQFRVTLDDKNDGHHEAKVTMRIWIDGWDPHTYDAIFGEKLGINLQFDKVPA